MVNNLGSSAAPVPYVAWRESTLVGARWLHLVGERTAVFRQLGVLAATEIRAVQEALPERAALRAWAAGPQGRAVVARLRATAERDYPDVMAELQAMADGAGVEFEALFVANLRGDVGVPDMTGCSDLALAGRRNVVAHNEDGAPVLDGAFMFVTLGIDDEPAVTAQWYPGFIPGNAHVVTSTGLAWGINHIQVREPADAAGRHFLARRLQQAADLDQAVSWLCSTPTAGGFTYTLGEFGTGRAVVVETAAGHMLARPVRRDSLAWHTNHLRWLPSELDASGGGPSEATDSLGLKAESQARGDYLARCEPPALADPAWFLGVLAERSLPDGVRRDASGDDPLMTLMTTVVDLDTRVVVLESPAGEQISLSVEDYLRTDEREDMHRDRAEVDGPALTLDLALTPLSHRGSWLSVSLVTGLGITADDPHIVSHRAGPRAVLGLSPEIRGARVQAELRAAPDSLTWTHDDGTMRLTFDGETGFRVRGTGVGLRIRAVAPELTSFGGTYVFADPGGGAVFTCYETGFRYLVSLLSGHLSVSGDQALGAVDRSVLVVADDPDAAWEIQLREARSGRAVPPDDPAPFDAVRDRNRHSYNDFRGAFDTLPDQSTSDLAIYVLWSSLVAAEGFVRRPAMLMSKNWMDKIWAWDHCFNALALAPAHPALAWDQFMVMFDHQDVATGALPDSVTHSEVLFNFVKPPVHGWALRELRRRLARPLTREQLTAAYDCLSRWSRFWLEHRRAPGHLLPYYEHGNDSGWDNSTTFDRARLIESPDLASFLIVQLDVLAELSDELEADPGERRHWTRERDAIYAALLAHLWDGAGFVARAVGTGRPSTGTSLLNLLPLVLADRLPAAVTEMLAQRLAAHLTAWGVATEPPTSAMYEADGYWRGPIWAPSSVLIDHGLRLAGLVEMADTARAHFLSLCARSGFAENFDAITGAGLRDRAYTWTASSYLVLASDQARSARSEAPGAGRGDDRDGRHRSPDQD